LKLIIFSKSKTNFN